MTVSRWGDAADLGARGRYFDAWRILDRLEHEPAPLPSLAASMRASHLRQIGEIEAALRHDERALACASEEQSSADARIGLAADAVAAGRPSDAHAPLAQAASDAFPNWRTSTRWHWVSAELALAEGRPEDAIDHAQRALSACEGLSDRHAAKSRVIAEAARGASGRSGLGADLLAAAAVARVSHLATLQWPIALVAADLTASGAVTRELVAEGPRLHREGAAAVRTIAEGLPESLRGAWLRGPAAARLLGDGE